MFRIGIIALFLLIFIELYSQEGNFTPPLYEKMRLKIFDNASPFYYPKLFERYQFGDTSITDNEFYFLYYGYTFHPKYIPFMESRYQEKMISYMKKGILSEKDLREFIKLAELNLKDLPFDIRTLNILAYSYKQIDDSINYRAAEFKKNNIIKVIKSSGDGLTEKTAFHIIYRSHEYDFLNELGLTYISSNDLSPGLCEYLLVQANETNIRGFYFNLSRLFNVKTEQNN